VASADPADPAESDGFDLFDWAASPDAVGDASDTPLAEGAETPFDRADASTASPTPFVWGLTPGVGTDPLVEPASTPPVPDAVPTAGPAPVPVEPPDAPVEPPTRAFPALVDPVSEPAPPSAPASIVPPAQPIAPVPPVAPIPPVPAAPPAEPPAIGLAALLGQSTQSTWTVGSDELPDATTDEPAREVDSLGDTVAFDMARAVAADTPTVQMDSIFAQPETPATELFPAVTPPEGLPTQTPTQLLGAPAEPLAELFGAAAWDAAETEVVPASPAPQPVEPAGGGSVPPTRQGPNTRTLAWLAAGLVALLVLIGLFALGTRLPALTAAPAATPSPTPSATPTPTPTPTVTPKPAAGLAAGVHPWNALGGGECLQPYTNPWAETFTVVDCATPHAAQLVYTNLLSADIAAPYPGADALASQINLLCTKPGVIDLGAAGQYPDLQLQGSYPATAKQWADGQRSYYCFASRSSGQPLTASVAGTGPTS
ncbi:MAG: hypothetical protein QOF36_2390, partial [Microbacteriaceae bacterium]|nr:hypothetical protein [Microbacteriaceae bacterium]